MFWVTAQGMVRSLATVVVFKETSRWQVSGDEAVLKRVQDGEIGNWIPKARRGEETPPKIPPEYVGYTAKLS